MDEKLSSVCGLDCKKCLAYIATINNDDELRAKTAAEWEKAYGHKFRVEDINCVGCTVKEGVHGGYCHACPLRACALLKDVANCFTCGDFAVCQKRKDFEVQTKMSIEKNFS